MGRRAKDAEEHKFKMFAPAGCCEQAKYIVTFLYKNLHPLPGMWGINIVGPDRDGWCIGDDSTNYRISFCPFCGTKADDITPARP